MTSPNQRHQTEPTVSPDILILRAGETVVESAQTSLSERPDGSLVVSAKDIKRLAQLLGTGDAVMFKPSPPVDKESQAERRLILLSGGLVIDTGERSMVIDGKKIGPTTKEFDLLCFFGQHPNIIQKRNMIYEAVWGDSYHRGRTLDVHVRKVRAHLGRYAEHLVTKRGVGYGLLDPFDDQCSTLSNL